METGKIQIGISSCLLGNEVRYNGGHCKDSYINGTLSEYFDFLPFCPEVAIGLGTPRPPIRLENTDQGIRVLGVKDRSIDVTEELGDYTHSRLTDIESLGGFIFKRASPSCGMERVKVYSSEGMPNNSGSGIFARGVMEAFPNLPVEEEGRLGDPALRENFIQRVFIYDYWRKEVAAEPGVEKLTSFHAKLKYTLMSHSPEEAKKLGALAASCNRKNQLEVSAQYFSLCMMTLKMIATRKKHTNVLQHIQGYLKNHLDKEDKAELVENIDLYRKGQLPLIVPVTLLKHYFRKAPHPYIKNSWYMSPYPQELKLRNYL